MTNTAADEIQRAAQALREQERFQEQLQSTNAAGVAAYGKGGWDKTLDRLSTFGQIDPADFAVILDSDDPAKVLHELGNDPAKYQRLMDLPPPRRRVELVKISIKETAKAPAAVTPPAPKADLSDKSSDADWFAARRRQKEERFKQQREAGRR
jgi:hypothetical protein